MTKGKIIVGLSGGVDSAVAALLLQRDGYDIQAVFMKNWSEDDFGGPCPWEEDQASAQAVARHLKIPLESWNFEQEYRDRVFKVMIHEYEQGRTPNPDILCNREIKFSIFLDKALHQAPAIATGHYAITKNGHLYKAKDGSKDQSYFLSAVSAAALSKTLFPIGELLKGDVRKIAKDAGLPNWDRPDSTGICFVGEKKMMDFLGKYIEPNPGPVKLDSGDVIGEHRGLQFYTIGQRRGFGHAINQAQFSKAYQGSTPPLRIVAKDVAANTLIVAPQPEVQKHTVTEFLATDLHLINPPCTFPWTGMAKMRYRQADTPVTVVPEGQGIRVICTEPQEAITPGQYVVLYQGHECIGCAVIDHVTS